MIKISNLQLTLNKIKILDDINFEIHSGEIVGVTGPSGSGKSSLVKAICGEHTVNPGMIEINSLDITAYTKKELRKTIVSLSLLHDYNPESTVYEEIISGRRHLKKFLNPYSEIDHDETSDTLETLGISSESGMRLKRCSESLLRMTLLAKIFNTNARIIALDMIESTLDLSQKITIIRTIKKYALNHNRTFIIVSSDIDFLVKVADSLIIMQNGSIKESGSCDIITEELVRNLFGIDVMIVKNIVTGLPEIHVIDK